MSLEEKKRRSEAERMLQNESGMSHVLLYSRHNPHKLPVQCYNISARSKAPLRQVWVLCGILCLVSSTTPDTQ